jgi:6-pyruvoyl-tetrahydropterin synthase
MAEIRNYRFTVEVSIKGEQSHEEQMIFEAYDLNEALTQFGIKYQDNPNAKVLEVIPFKYIEEQKPVTEQKKEVHVKSIPKHLFPMRGLDTTKLPDTD